MSDSKGAAIRKEIIGSLSRVQLYDVSEAGELAIEVEADQILAILAQEVKRIIGEDEVAIYSSDKSIVNIKNKLRAEQRRKAGLV